jgi:hypothetical protein
MNKRREKKLRVLSQFATIHRSDVGKSVESERNGIRFFSNHFISILCVLLKMHSVTQKEEML